MSKYLLLIITFLFGLLDSCKIYAGEIVPALSYPNIRTTKQRVAHRLTQKMPLKSLYNELQSVSYSSDDEELAMNFLYAYMELADLLNYSVDFYLDNVRTSLMARREMNWGSHIPQEIFMHYVLPIRVNNEFLDNSRLLFYQELKSRVQGLNMGSAALEVNHWCHEYVTYAPSDARTLSPLATKCNALGRCGEESTFTVAAMRAVGIPARQVYTPRWAHTDDNHAWVEVWIDGKWHFLGACEPAAELDVAWFNSSVKRAMLVHTKVFGQLGEETTEEVVTRGENFTEVNSIANYTSVRQISVLVVDEYNQPVVDAEVRYCLYNYAEFFPVVTKKSNKEGVCSPLRVGRGDMLLWACKGGKQGYAIASRDTDEIVRIVLKKVAFAPDTPVDFKMVPPQASEYRNSVEAEKETANQVRWQHEDAIRSSYEASFFDENKATLFATRCSLSEENTQRLVRYLQLARGNYKNLTSFLQQIGAEEQNRAVALLSTLSEKDYTDVQLSTLLALFKDMPRDMDPFMLQYVSNPRIENEHLSAYREELRSAISEEESKEMQQNPALILKWMSKHFRSFDDENIRQLSILPLSVLHHRVYDERAAKLFFVAMARSLDIPARLNAVTNEVEYTTASNAPWVQVKIKKETVHLPQTGQLQLLYTSNQQLPMPKYYSHFTIARLTEEGAVSTLYYDENTDCSLKVLFATPQDFEVGKYLVIAGTRMANGMVVGKITPFEIVAGQCTKVILDFPKDENEVAVIGSFNPEETYISAETGVTTPIIATSGRGYFVLAVLDPGTEPTNHALKDLEKVQKQLDEWRRPFIFLFETENKFKVFDIEKFPKLPKGSHWGIDTDNRVQKMLRKGIFQPENQELPLVVVVDSFGRIVFAKQGYTIGLGEQILNILPKL